MQTPEKKSEMKMAKKPEKNVEAKYVLPLLKVDGVARNLLSEFNGVPKLRLPEVKPLPEDNEICHAPRVTEENECEPVDEMSYSE
jgi:hypothetical protein